MEFQADQAMVSASGGGRPPHITINRMKLWSSIAAAAAVFGATFFSGHAYAQGSTCKFEGAPTANCQISHKRIKGGWKDEVLVEPNGTMRIITRNMRGDGVNINLYAPGQRKGSLHSGTYRVVGKKFPIYTEDGGSYTSLGSQVIIYVDGGRFSYTL